MKDGIKEQPQRILARELAREITAEELKQISGGAGCQTVTIYASGKKDYTPTGDGDGGK